MRVSLIDRLTAKIGPPTAEGCWPWVTSARSDYGYIVADGRKRRVHRVVYEIAVGPIPLGMPLDHTCHNEAAARGECKGGLTCPHRRCVNPAHLEAVTNGENTRRGLTGQYLSRVTRCPQGHPYDDKNTYRDPRGQRGCKACRRESVIRYRQRKAS